MKDHKAYLYHILDAISKILNYTKGISYQSFAKNEEKQDAVVRNLEIIGEAAAKIPLAFRQQKKDVSWRDMIDMRNRLIHEYSAIDYVIVWDVVKKELPLLRRQIRKILK